MATNCVPQECVIFVQTTKIGTHENKAIHSSSWPWLIIPFCVGHFVFSKLVDQTSLTMANEYVGS